MAIVDPKVIADLVQLAMSRLTLEIEQRLTVAPAQPAEVAGMRPIRVTTTLSQMIDSIDEIIAALINDYRDELFGQRSDSFVTDDVIFRLSPSQEGPDILDIEPNGSFNVTHNGERIAPPSVTIKLAPR